MLADDWILWNDSWYYLSGSGVMITNQWVLWKGNWYYLTNSGKMAADTVINGYTVNANGIWVA